MTVPSPQHEGRQTRSLGGAFGLVPFTRARKRGGAMTQHGRFAVSLALLLSAVGGFAVTAGAQCMNVVLPNSSPQTQCVCLGADGESCTTVCSNNSSTCADANQDFGLPVDGNSAPFPNSMPSIPPSASPSRVPPSSSAAARSEQSAIPLCLRPCPAPTPALIVPRQSLVPSWLAAFAYVLAR